MPRLKFDGRHGTLRYQTPLGKKVVGGRLAYLKVAAAEAQLSGWGRNFEVRLWGGSWHSLTLSDEEAEAVVRSSAVAPRDQQRRVDRCLARREKNLARW